MSSNTLRGIGQEGEGDGEGEGGEAAGLKSDRGEGRQASPEPEDSQDQTSRDAKSLFDGLQQLRNVRSLDSSVPGTRSLDASVPDAAPSLDAKVPSLAATMMGLSAPVILGREQGREQGREKGTVQGRDIHLPPEVQRMAGVRSVAGSHDAIPAVVDRSEPTLADPVHTAAPAQTAGESIHGHAHGHADLTSHAPWYDQEPAGGDVYDDPKPNIFGRLAIGAAVAAGLSVVLFAAVRLRGQDAAAEQSEAPTAAPAIPIVSTPEPAPIPVAPQPAPMGAVPPPDPVVEGSSPPAAPTVPPQTKPTSSPIVVNRTARPIAASPRTAPASPAAVSSSPRTPTSPLRKAVARPSLPMAAVAIPPVPPIANPPQQAAPPPEGDPPTQPTAPPAGKRAAPEKSRGKAYDPDSTLPLNID